MSHEDEAAREARVVSQRKLSAPTWLAAWFVSLTLLGGVVTAVLRPGLDTHEVIVSALVWGLLGAAIGLAVLAGDTRPRARRGR